VQYGHGTIWGEQAKALALAIREEIRRLNGSTFEVEEFTQDPASSGKRRDDLLQGGRIRLWWYL